MHTLEDIYHKLTNTALDSAHTLNPTAGPAGTMHTVEDIYNASIDTDLVAGNIADGVTIFGVEGSLASSEPGLPKTGQTTFYVIGDDGDLEKGIAMSYTVNDNDTLEENDDTVTDNVTGLVWQKDGAYNASSWSNAVGYCLNNTAGLPGTGWRLPNFKELVSIVDLGRVSPSINPVFTNTQSDGYWSGTTFHDSTGFAWYVSFSNGGVDSGGKAGDSFYARCVR